VSVSSLLTIVVDAGGVLWRPGQSYDDEQGLCDPHDETEQIEIVEFESSQESESVRRERPR